MKTTKIFCAALIALLIGGSVKAGTENDSLGKAGDNLDLEAVLELFKKSENPEAFEKALNSKDSEINNLDLNGDNKTDYIRVVDHSKEESHALVLQVPVNEKEMQDVAVIEVEKKGTEEAHLQIVGDEELYGKDYIIEPSAEEGKSAVPESKTTVVVNVYHWPAVHYIYRPAYVYYVSPWRWGYYPVWWSPWAPVYWHAYHRRTIRYHGWHRRVYTHRVVHAHSVYAPHRRSSAVVTSRTVHRNSGTRAEGNHRSQKAERAGRQSKADRGAAPRQSRKQAQQGGRKQNAPRGAGQGGGSRGGRQGGKSGGGRR